MKQKKQIIWLVSLVAVAGIVWYYERIGTPSGRGTATVAENNQLLSVENPQLHRDRLEAAQKTEYKSAGRNPFSPQLPPPPVDISKTVAPAPHPTVPADPTPPPVQIPPNMKFFGYGTVPNGTVRRAFFTDGEDVFIVSEGEVFLNRFRIVKVGNTNLDIEEVSSGRHGTVPLEEQAALPASS
jgi:hypothetical protein